MSDRIEIKLTEVDQVPVGLRSMNAEAMDSFIAVVVSLKAIAENVVGKENLTFSIVEGSASCSVAGPPSEVATIIREIDKAIIGESTNKDVTDSLRRIQAEVKKDNLGYQFNYHQSDTVVDVRGRLASSTRIVLNRGKGEYRIKLRVNSGTIKQIGGENPNYHLDYGGGEKRTISCTVQDAVKINQYLYQVVNPLVLCKEFNTHIRPNEYFHLALVDSELSDAFRQFVAEYNSSDDIISRLDKIHDFVDYQFSTREFGHKTLQTLLYAFNDVRFHLSEIKTLLVISKPFKAHNLIREPRIALLETYNTKRE